MRLPFRSILSLAAAILGGGAFTRVGLGGGPLLISPNVERLTTCAHTRSGKGRQKSRAFSQRQIRKDRRRAWAAGNRFAFA